MKDKAFFDTNIFFYAFDSKDLRKQQIARNLLSRDSDRRRGVVSGQVHLEFAANLIKKFGFSGEDVLLAMKIFEPFAFVPVIPPLIKSAVELHTNKGFSIWDATIVSAALDSQCTTLYSEDLQDGQSLGLLKIVNPFVG